MKILVTGSNGQLGSEIRELVGISCEIPNLVDNDRFEYVFTDSKLLDVTNHRVVRKFIIDNGIKTIVNCAAYTAVDKAELDVEMADKINHLAVANIARVAKENNIRLIHISTDYIFDGENYRPYLENDQTNPQSVYGITKLAGERAIQNINPKNSIIIRTSWVYSYYGANFVKTMLRLGRERDSLGVVYDQIGTPTYAKDLARTVIEIIKQVDFRVRHGNDSCGVAIYNYSNEGVTSWYDFAKEIMNIAKLSCQVNPIQIVDYPTPAKRPYYSLLSKKKIKQDFDISMPYWKDSLQDCIKRLQKDL